MLWLLSCCRNTLWMSNSVNQQDTAAQTTSSFHWLTHCYTNTCVVDLVLIDLQDAYTTVFFYKNAVITKIN